MHKNALFLLKRCKNRPALGASLPDPLAFGGLGALHPAAALRASPQTPMASGGSASGPQLKPLH